MNQTNNESQKRKWGCGGCLLAFVAVLVLLVVTRITLVWQDREAQTKQLYALATQLGYTADSEVLQDRDWYCIDWDMFGRKKCAVFLAYTTTLDAEQMKVFAKTVGVVDAYDRSNAPNYVMSNLQQFVVDTAYLPNATSTGNNKSESKLTRLEWWLSNGYFMNFYEVARLSPPITFKKLPLKNNIIVLYGQFHISWIF